MLHGCLSFKKNFKKVLVVQKKGLPLHPQSGKQVPKAKNAEIAQLVEHNLAKVGVASSSLVFRSLIEQLFCGNSSVGRAQPCQGWGREFEPRFPLKRKKSYDKRLPRWRNGRRARFRCEC